MQTINKYLSLKLVFIALVISSFVTACGGGSSTAKPKITSVDPSDGATAISINSKVVASFNTNMYAASIDDASFTVVGAGEPALTGTIQYDDYSDSVSFTSDSIFTASTVYTATITTAVKSSKNKALASDYVWSFTSGTTADTTDPEVSSTDPIDDATGFAINRNISAVFNESLDPASVNSDSFTLTSNAGATKVSGKIRYEKKLVTFNPNNNLADNTVYTATLTTDITDLAGNNLTSNYVWSFETGAAIALGPKPVNLRTAGDFVILSKSGITNVPTSAITGNIGASPITATAIDVTCTEITGTIYGADAAYTGTCFAGTAPDNTLVANAVLDMGTAYNDAAGRTTPDFTELHAGDISGKTLVPGLYKWGTNVLINTDVTLSGGANDVWIFQISGDLIQAANTSVTLAGGALPKNIFWQVEGGTGVAINTDASFEGVVLAIKGITVNTNSVVNGRLLSQTAVTLEMNTVTEPAE
jgi:hypothetical protein